MKYLTATFFLFVTEYLWRLLLILITETIAPGSYGDATWLMGREVNTDNLFRTAQSYPFQLITFYFMFLVPLYFLMTWLTDKSWQKLAELLHMDIKYVPYLYGLIWLVDVMLLKWLYVSIEGATLWPWEFHTPAVYFILGYTAAFLMSREPAGKQTG
jgi:hypothetical protein